MSETEFRELIWQKGRELYRPMPWRDCTDPYYILVSELMLQQTQVQRVIPKFEVFIAQFPTLRDLASASLSDVIAHWSGLGYNRRAQYLHAAARLVCAEFNGVMPDTYDELLRLPGVGPNTAGAIMAYAYNQPVIFIETNIRTVFFHHFFDGQAQVSDSELRPLIQKMVDVEHPREWYWAMMDYGTLLKGRGHGRITQSMHYKKQSALKGSVREVRGQIIRALIDSDKTDSELRRAVMSDERFDAALLGVVRDGLVQTCGSYFHLTK